MKISTTSRILLVLLCSLSSLYGEIVETPHFSDTLNYTEEGTLLLLDIDDTLLIPVQMLGCDNWFMHQHSKFQSQGAQDALEKALAQWEAVRHLTEVEIVETGTEQLVARLQKGKCVVMGLTTQGLSLATRTVQQLKSLGIDLSKSAPSSEDHYFINTHGVLYRQGILFTSGTPKGKALFKLLDQIGYHPKKIVFINDKDSHLKDIEEEAAIRGVPYVGLRYSYSDARKAAFRAEIADIQFKRSSFDRILSDEEAVKFLPACVNY